MPPLDKSRTPVDPAHFFHLLHAMLRKDDSEAEDRRVALVNSWLADGGVEILKRVVTSTEKKLLRAAEAHREDHRDAPTAFALRAAVEALDTNLDAMELFEAYEAWAESASARTVLAADLDAVLKARVEDFNRVQVTRIADTAKLIANGGYKLEAGSREKAMSGPDDARRYLLEHLDRDLVSPDSGARGGSLRELSAEVGREYADNLAEKASNTLLMPTGIPELDKTIGGIRRGNFVGVLGYTGARKSTLCRTIAYNVAKLGFKVLYLSFEQDYREEVLSQVVLHAHESKFGGHEVSKRKFDSGTLSPQEIEILRNRVLPDLGSAEVGGKIVFRQSRDHTFASFKAVAEAADKENPGEPLDLIVLDYFSLLDTGASGKDFVLAMNNAIREAKQWIENFHPTKGGPPRKVALLTPVQGNREGWDRARKNNGQWDLAGIAQYNEFEKSLDICMFIHKDDKMDELGNIFLGVVKSRRSRTVPAFVARVFEHSDRISDLGAEASVGSERSARQAAEPPPEPEPEPSAAQAKARAKAPAKAPGESAEFVGFAF